MKKERDQRIADSIERVCKDIEKSAIRKRSTSKRK